MKKVFIALKIIQEVSNEDRRKKGLKPLGKGYFEANRVNPYNPLSYILIAILIPIVILLYGFVGLIDKWENPFRWN